MDFVKFFTDNWQIISTYPKQFIACAVFFISVAWIAFKYIHNERIIVLQDRLLAKDDQLKLKDDQINYYKNLEKTTTANQNAPSPEFASPLGKNIRADILAEIQFLTKETGRSLSIELFERLKHKYDFSTILTEILIMGKENKLKWAEVPDPPDALSAITIVQG